MKTYLLTLFVLFCFTSKVFAQQPKYYRVQLFTNEKGLQRLSVSGVAIDHGETKKGYWFISDFSEDELMIIKHSKIPYKVLIDDVASYYVNRNNTPEENIQAAAACATYTTPVNFTLGRMGGYYKYNEMLAALDNMVLKFPSLITAKQIVSSTLTTAQGRRLYYVKISDNPNTNESEPKILYTALHHAREPESLSQLIFFMWYLLENYKTNSYVKSLVDSTEMYFIPCVNPDGYIYNQTTNPNGGGLWRKNRRNNGGGSYGVDLNRNYSYKWGYDNVGSSGSTSSDTYRGPSAFSEPETRMIRNFCNFHSFFFSLNHHTYGNYMIYPYGYKANTLTPDANLFSQYATRMVQCNAFKPGTANQTVGYVANGVSDDWMYAEQSTKAKIFALTAETGSGTDGFWPRSSRIIPIAQANMDMNLAAAQYTKASVLSMSFVASENDNMLKTDTQIPVAVLSNAPNPCNNYTYITYRLDKVVSTGLRLDIFNASGVQVQSIKLNAGEAKVLVNTTNLITGVYYYSITNGKSKSAVEKLIVIK
jgi:carboxypeptidase T